MNPSPLLPPGQQRVARHKWPLVGERQSLPPPAEWTVELGGCVARPLRLTLAQLANLRQTRLDVDIHCVTRWSRPQTPFEGVLLADALAVAEPLPSAQFVSFIAHSPRWHDTSLPLAAALELNCLLALRADGAPLTADHGGPVRSVTPGRYFYKSLKWLTRIELLTEDRLGYWEREAGYHNEADPWLEQRYMAPRLTRGEMRAAILSKDFAGRDLRSLQAAGRDLTGLQARAALLRDADFTDACLRGAVLDGANLTNAHLRRADLRSASLRDAGLEGADLAGADLRGANLTGASLFGATFCVCPAEGAEPTVPARFDSATQIDPEAFSQLTPLQETFARQALADAREHGADY